MRLFIIGNGYDIARGCQTNYSCFKNWLIEQQSLNPLYKEINSKWKNKEMDFKCFLSYSIFHIEDENEKRKALASALLLNCMPNDEWNSFEDSLASLSIKDVLEFYMVKSNGACAIGSPVSIEVDVITSLSSEIHTLFSNWISSLKINKIIKKGFEKEIIKEIKKDDIFLIFNYTDSLERGFPSITEKNVCHIHGSMDKGVVFGHNCKEKSKSTNLNTEDDYINEFFARLYKNPEAIIKNNKQLWKKIESAKELDIYEYGWSCSNSDKDYIKKICDSIREKKSCNLYLNDFGGKGIEKRNVWIANGFLDENIILYDEDGYSIKYK